MPHAVIRILKFLNCFHNDLEHMKQNRMFHVHYGSWVLKLQLLLVYWYNSTEVNRHTIPKFHCDVN